ncbi:MAG: restriction endonuclease subunit S [Flavobacteriales bacterium]
MKSTIQQIASIQTGVFARPTGSGDLVYLQARHFEEDGRLVTVLHPDLSAEGITQKHILREGDILFAAKGSKNFAAVYEAHNQPAVASTSFFVIRPMVRFVNPEFLAWCLNSPAILSQLKAQATGTGIPSISKQVLEAMEIDIPDLSTQKAIVRIAALRRKQQKLQRKLDRLRDRLIQHKITSAIQRTL